MFNLPRHMMRYATQLPSVSNSISHSFSNFSNKRLTTQALVFNTNFTSANDRSCLINRRMHLISPHNKCQSYNSEHYQQNPPPYSKLLTAVGAVGVLLITKNDDVYAEEKQLTAVDINSRDKNGNTPLIKAIIYGDKDEVELLLKSGANPNTANSHGKMPLQFAVDKDDVGLAELLLKYKARVNARDQYRTPPLHTAVSKGSLSMATLLLKYGAKMITDAGGNTPLDIAVIKNNPEMVTLLLNMGMVTLLLNSETQIDVDSPLCKAVDAGHLSIAKLLLEFLAEHSPYSIPNLDAELMYTAVKNDDTEMTKLLLKYGWIVNAANQDHTTPLHIAVKKCKGTKMVEFLLNNGAKVTASEWQGDTPLHMLYLTEELATAQLLLDRGANINATNRSGETPLMETARTRNVKMVELLLRNKPNTEIKNNNGHTALHIAAINFRRNVLKVLAEHGAKIDTTDNSNHTPLQSIILKNLYGPIFDWTKQTAKDLIKYGADINRTNKQGQTLLHTVSESNDSCCLAWTKLLLQNGANPNLKDKDGNTPLHKAIKKGCKNTIKILIKHGASTEDIENNEGDTPMDIARSQPGQEIFHIINEELAEQTKP